MKSLFGFIIGFVLSTSAWASDFNVQCGKFPSPLPGGYCVHIPTHDPSGDILYYLHGKENDETTWQDENFYTSQIRSEWKAQNNKLPIVISVSFGPIWVLAEQNTSSASGLFEVFTGQVVPMLEAKLGGLKGRRLVIGESMGGFNAIQLALKTSLFSKAAILCSPMSQVSPFANKSDILDYVKSTGAWQYYKDSNPNLVLQSVDDSVQLAQVFFPTEEDWAKGNPLDLAVSKAISTTELYVANGYHDQYASYEATVVFANLLQSNGRKIEWRPQWGGHCAIDIPSVTQFLVK